MNGSLQDTGLELFFSVRPKRDVLLNNLYEVFNKKQVPGKDKPIITCLEFTRHYCMKRIMIVHKLIAKSNGPLTTNDTRVFEKIKSDASQNAITWCGTSKYQ